MKETMDKRMPKLEKVGCYHWQGDGHTCFLFFKNNPNVKQLAKDGDVFIYARGVLWRIRK